MAGRIDVPTLLIQGENDSLFGLDQANGELPGHPAQRRAGGHGLVRRRPRRREPGDQPDNPAHHEWFDRWLRPGTCRGVPVAAGGPGATGQPAFAVTRDLGFDPSSGSELLGVATAPRYPGLAGTRRTAVRLGGPAQTIINPPGGAPPSMSVLPGPRHRQRWAWASRCPGQSAAFTSAPLPAPLQQTGSATVRIRVSGAADITVFAEVYDVDQAGNATLPFGLAAPLRVTGAAPAGAGAGRSP